MSGQDYFPLPITFEELTPEWLTAALRQRAPGATVHQAKIVHSVHGTTTKITIELEVDDTAKRAGIPDRIVVKGGFEKHSREIGMNQMFKREIAAYRDVFPEIPLHTPTCYFADYDPDRMQGIVIMEDLVARGVEFCHARKPQTHEQVARRMKALARFHAKTWNSSELRADGKWGHLVDFFDVMRPFFDHYTSPDVWKSFVDSPRGAASSVVFQDPAWMVASWDRQTAFSQSLPQCVLHGDIHLGNLYIDTDGEPGFFDSITSTGPGMLEVSYHISASIDTSVRRDWEGSLIQCYLDELTANGVAAPSFTEALHQYTILLLYGYFIWMTTEADRQYEPVNTANVARVSNAMLDHQFMRKIAELT